MTENIKQYQCLLIGQQSLLIECGQQLLDRGYAIALVISSDPDVAAWCRGKKLKLRDQNSKAYSDLDNYHFDYLFSIVNLKIVPSAVLCLPSRLAINFHDGPLPRYAGINAPVWSILNQETEHGVTWHQMTEKVDAGDILKQHRFPVSPDETAFSLNIKCLEQGLVCFAELLDDIDNDAIVSVPHHLDDDTWCPPCKSLSLRIDLSGTAEQISALTRALEFGPYYNPVGLARLVTGNRLIVVRQADILQQSSGLPVGTVISCTSDSLVLATSSYDISLTRLYDESGHTYSPEKILSDAGIYVGDILPVDGDIFPVERLNTRQDICLQEPYWIKALTGLQLTIPPYAEEYIKTTRKSLVKAPVLEIPGLPELYGPGNDDPTPVLLAAVLVYLYRLTGHERVDLILDEYSHEHDKSITDLYQACIPYGLTIDEKTGFTEFCQQVTADLCVLAGHAMFGKDLFLRTPDLKSLPYYTDKRPFPVVLGYPGSNDDEVCRIGASLYIRPGRDATSCEWFYHPDVYTEQAIENMQKQFSHMVSDLSSSGKILGRTGLLNHSDIQSLLIDWNATEKPVDRSHSIQQLFEEQVSKTPERLALVCYPEELTYSELNRRANTLANYLIDLGVKPESLVGIHMQRSSGMMIALLATLKAGGAYVPLDPAYPDQRIQYMVKDAGLSIVITDSQISPASGNTNFRLIDFVQDQDLISKCDSKNPTVSTNSSDAAYVIYTSGSTGQPKGVVVEQGNVINFFTGMDEVLRYPDPGTWLAVTSISFDISVLELFWTLTRGFTVVLYVEPDRQIMHENSSAVKAVDFSLFYWNLVSEEEANESKYRLLLESARYGDENGFTAVWTPERHFHDFGGLFPNPSVVSAALAVTTKNIQIRAGSCVLPLHNPIRVAEEWSIVDNLSGGRVGIAIASGWQPEDFVIKPENFSGAKTILFESLEQLRLLWKGESIMMPGPKGEVSVSTLPRPVQHELPVWVTVAGNPDTFKKAAEVGAGILTHLLGQTIEELTEKLELYRSTWRQCGHKGHGHVTLMLHTLVSDSTDKAKEIAREPMKKYLASAVFLVKKAAWNFPTFKETSEETGATLDEYFETISDTDLDDLLEFAFERYFGNSGLFGSPQDCLKMINRVNQAGVDEIGCLIDYGITTDVVLENLPWLNELKNLVADKAGDAMSNVMTMPALVERYKVSHFQCTPSMAAMLLADNETADIFSSINNVLIGGESMSENLASELARGTSLTNMYGPTESTIWSCSFHVQQEQKRIPVGRPLANTQVYVLDKHLHPVPAGVRGEICISGHGVVRGYLNRPELTRERFVEINIPGVGSTRIYRTGDYGCMSNSGQLICMGRMDQQIKLRGFRIELGEIESAMEQSGDIEQAIACLVRDSGNSPRLAAYYRLSAGSHVTATGLRSFLRGLLPEYMIPQHFVELQEFPLTPNQKVDRSQLPSPMAANAVARTIEQPETETEKILASIWCELIGIDSISLDDNFIIIGGHSILAMRALAKIRDVLGIKPAAVMIYQKTLREVAKECDRLAATVSDEQQDKSVFGKLIRKFRER